ncbi:flagellar hook-length control protein FliK [Sneathiella sp. CAU 1612]|uniref:Flagellar hook-length control protein FliK n=1 Tax=Sneathiella sedimenti TaxID=2816034 RepID=A0ABS3F9Y1_9PROT|nr:flagellar hook-length control protein FliK [Sneathiella sedimenti]MBO0335199.1 flagellar hook-length control protein FliK [Sneathiella sedimenti]
MDVGQIITATTDPTRRDSDPYRNDAEDFASYVNETAPKYESPAKEKSASKNATTDEPVSAQNAALQKPTENDSTFENEATATEDAMPASQAANTSSVAVPLPSVVPASPATSTGLEGVARKPSVASATAQASVSTPLADTSHLPINVTANTGKKLGSTAVDTNVKNSETATAPVTKANEKAAVATPQDAKTANASPDVLTNLRAEANAKLSEKDILSSKIAEMLQDGKGKISLTATKQQQSFQTALASSTNLVTATMTNSTATPNPTLLSASGGDLNGAATQTSLPASGGIQGLPAESLNQTVPTAPTGSVQGVDATATNAMSQASNAARAAAHLPVAEQVSTQISAAIKEGHDRIKISLHPSELGRVEVKLDIGHDGRVLAVVSVDKQETLDLLQRDARSLERALQDAGFDTGSNSLNFNLSQNGQDGEGEDLNFANVNMPIEETGEDTGLSNLPLHSKAGTPTSDGGLDIQV